MQGFNMGRYVPPDVQGTTSANALHGKHPLGSRASKLHSHGILTVRFELPFAVWCTSCRPEPVLIGQGVRFNAQKRRVGSYFTTPIWSFRFKHGPCGAWIDVRTDPENTAYVVVEGARRRDQGEDVVRDGDLVLLTDAEREARRGDAFASLERTIGHREQVKLATQRIDDLMDASARFWDDPYAHNQRLRAAFREGRKEREQDARTTEDLQARMSLGIDLLPATADDARRAALVDFQPAQDTSDRAALSRPLFAAASASNTSASDPSARTSNTPPPGSSRAERDAARRRDGIVSGFMDNTRAARDPFIFGSHSARPRTPPAQIPPLRKKRPLSGAKEPPLKWPASEPSDTTGLVNYNSDSN